MYGYGPLVTLDFQLLSLTRGAGFVTVSSRPSEQVFALSAAFASNCEHLKSKRFWFQQGETSVSALSHKGNAAVVLPRRALWRLGFYGPGPGIQYQALRGERPFYGAAHHLAAPECVRVLALGLEN